jgi:hypothetical protein
MLLRGAVLVAAYWVLWVAIGRALPSWLTVAFAAVFWPLLDRFSGRTTSPKSLLLIPMVVGVLGSMYGRMIQRRRQASTGLAR